MKTKTKHNIVLAKNLKRLMDSRGVTIAKVSRDLGLNKSTLFNYCNGTIPNGLLALNLVAGYFGVSLTQLLDVDSIDSITLRITGELQGNYIFKIERI